LVIKKKFLFNLFYIPILVSKIKISLLDHRRVDTFESESVRFNLIVLWSLHLFPVQDRYCFNIQEYTRKGTGVATARRCLWYRSPRFAMFWEGRGWFIPC